MDRQIIFKGDIAQFGEEWNVSADTIADVFKLIECQTPGFRQYMIDAVEAGLDLAIVSADNLNIEHPEELFMNNAGGHKMYVSLVPAGAKKGWGKILAAIVLVVVAFFTGGAGAAGIGPGGGGLLSGISTVAYAAAVSLALQGVAQLMAKSPETTQEEQGPGIFNGPINTVKSGQPVPVLYGELLVGGAPIHVNLATPVERRFGLPFPIFPISTTAATVPPQRGSGDLTPVPQDASEAVVEQNAAIARSLLEVGWSGPGRIF